MIIAGRAEIFGFTFILTSLLLLLRDDPWAWTLGYAAYGMALLFKESALITPLLLACLYAYQGVSRSVYWRLAPYFVLAILEEDRRTLVGKNASRITILESTQREIGPFQNASEFLT